MADGKKIIRLADVGELEAHLLEALEHPARQLDHDDVITCGEAISCEIEDLKQLPTIDPESLRPTAKWVVMRRMADGAECKCGNCGRHETFTSFDRHTDHVYCCRCGYKMEGFYKEITK
nr:MAG TPA: TFIIB-TERMINAL DOMAIN, TFIIB, TRANSCRIPTION INITIATION [Caudoviricetes sp.]